MFDRTPGKGSLCRHFLSIFGKGIRSIPHFVYGFCIQRDIMNELNHMEDNLESVRDMKFPESVPVLQFVSGDNCEMMESWEPLHRKLLRKRIRVKCCGWTVGIICILSGKRR